MPARRQPRIFAAAPFWLLVAAWLLANSPQAAVCELIDWAGHARHFTHQERLRAEVASLLTERTEATPRATVEHASERHHPAPVLPGTVLKKIELAMQPSLDPLTCGSEEGSLRVSRLEHAGLGRDRPPHGPPRTASSVAGT